MSGKRKNSLIVIGVVYIILMILSIFPPLVPYGPEGTVPFFFGWIPRLVFWWWAIAFVIYILTVLSISAYWKLVEEEK